MGMCCMNICAWAQMCVDVCMSVWICVNKNVCYECKSKYVFKNMCVCTCAYVRVWAWMCVASTHTCPSYLHFSFQRAKILQYGRRLVKMAGCLFVFRKQSKKSLTTSWTGGWGHPQSLPPLIHLPGTLPCLFVFGVSAWNLQAHMSYYLSL